MILLKANTKIKIEFSDIELQLGDYRVILNHVGYAEPFCERHIIPHEHTIFELHCISKGEGILSTPAEQYPMTAGTVCLTGPGVYHGQDAKKENGMDEYCLRFHIEPHHRSLSDRQENLLAEAILNHPFFLTTQTGTDQDGYWWRILDEMIAEACHQQAGYRKRISCLFENLLIQLGRSCGGITTVEAPERPLQLVIGEIDLKPRLDTYLIFYNKPVPIETILSELHITRRHFSRLMRQYYGMSYTEKINQLRISYARQLLLYTDDTVETIAGKIGYRTPSYFTKVFSRLVGKSPSEYRLNP